MRNTRELHRILNLNHFGTRALAVIGLFGVVFPVILYGISILLEAFPQAVSLPSGLVRQLMIGSLGVGCVLLAVFVILLIVEQIQDVLLYQVYRKSRAKRIPLADGRYECQFCGCRTLREFEHTCPVCGKVLE